jgi:hypothetical protein
VMWITPCRVCPTWATQNDVEKVNLCLPRI